MKRLNIELTPITIRKCIACYYETVIVDDKKGKTRICPRCRHNLEVMVK